MAQIDIGDAAMTGVRLTFRKPLTVLTWGALPVGYMVLILFLFGRSFISAVAALAASGNAANPDPQLIVGMIGSVLGLISMMFLGFLVIAPVVTAAAIRAVMEPSSGSFAYLRLGGQELWILGVSIVLYLIIVVVSVVVNIPFLILSLAFAFQGAGGGLANPGGFAQMISGTIGIRLIGQLVTVAVQIWLWCRLAPGVVMTFKERQFRLFESWNLTKGHSWNIFLSMLLVYVILIGLGIVAYIIIGGVAFGTIFTAPGLMTHPQTFFSRPVGDWIGIFGPTLAISALLFVVLEGLSLAMRWGTVARIYGDLAPAAGVAETFA